MSTKSILKFAGFILAILATVYGMELSFKARMANYKEIQWEYFRTAGDMVYKRQVGEDVWQRVR